MARYDTPIIPTVGLGSFGGAGYNRIVAANNGNMYFISINSANDLFYCRSTNGGKDWSTPTVLIAGTVHGFSVWYDRWSGLTSDYIHLVYNDAVSHDTLYRTINTASSDALSTQTVVFAGASAVSAGSNISVTRSRGGNVYCKTQIDAGSEGGFFKLLNANVPNGAWSSALTNTEALATLDQQVLVPGFAADNQDIMCMFWDASADEISRYVYDDSANTWAETSIATSMVEIVTTGGTGGFPNMNVEVDLANSKILLAAWSATDTVNADLRFWDITEGAITEKTNVVLNSADDQALCAVQVNTDNGDIYVYYVGKSDGTETWSTSLNVYCKKSTDGGTTWGSETRLTNYSGAYRNLIPLLRVDTDDILKVGSYDHNTAMVILSQDYPEGAGGGEFGFGFS